MLVWFFIKLNVPEQTLPGKKRSLNWDFDDFDLFGETPIYFGLLYDDVIP